MHTHTGEPLPAARNCADFRWRSVTGLGRRSGFGGHAGHDYRELAVPRSVPWSNSRPPEAAWV